MNYGCISSLYYIPLSLLSSLFSSNLGFSQILDSLYGMFWQCSRVWL